MNIHRQKETYEYVYKGISIFVRIDYVNNNIDLLERTGNDFKVKKWIFSHRGVAYMNGWLLVLEAMKYAIKDAKAKYEANLAEESRFKKKNADKLTSLSSRVPPIVDYKSAFKSPDQIDYI